MAVISKDLGAVTAYAAAVNRGYTGTKEEFETLMASYATVAEQAAESAQSASSSAQGASQAASSANSAMNNARTAESNAQSATSWAQGYAQSAQQSAQSASQSATDAESAKNTAVDAVDGFAAGAQQALDSVNSAGNNWKSLAQAQKLDAEAWAVGKRDGADVGSSDETYHNNAKYYAESVSASAQTATEAAQTATTKASEAAQSASAAAESARTLTIDATLTQAGQAADAKVVGDALAALSADLDENVSDLKSAIKSRNIIEGVLSAAFANVGGTYKINANANERIIYFPVESGKVYTVVKGTVMSSARLAYSTTVPEIGGTVTGYSDFASQTLDHNSFTASQDGYACVRITWSGDVATPAQVLEAAYAYEGAYDTGTSKQSVDIEHVLSIDGESWAEIMRKLGFIATGKVQFATKAYIATAGVGQQIDLTVHAFNDTDCAVVDVIKGQPFLLSGTPRDNSGTRAFCWVDSAGTVVYRFDGTNVLNEYEIYAPVDGKLVINFLRSAPYAVYTGMKDVMQTASANRVDIRNYTSEPLTNLPDYFINTMAYRPIGGELEKGYICLLTDDGDEGLATYTIPMLIEKEVPFTFALFKDSEVFQTAAYQTAVLDVVTNHGCAISQHGGCYWDILTERELNAFFDEEKAFFDSLGVTLEGAVIPGHRTTTLVKAIAGGRFGVVRSGYQGQAPDFSYNDSIQNYYDFWTSGARSNVYGLSSYNISGATDAYNKQAVDYAKANHKILIGYYHEFDLTPEKQTIIESMIDYAKEQGLTFITLGQIPTIR